MSCREHKREIYKTPQAYAESVATTGAANEIFTARMIPVDGFRSWILYVNLPNGVTAAAGNLPINIKAYAVWDTADAANNRVLIQTKCLTDVTGWSGSAFLEIGETHIARFLDHTTDNKDIVALQFSIEGPNATTYDTVVTVGKPEFESPDNVLEAFTK